MTNTIKAFDYPEMYEALGIDTSDMGCVMFNTEPIVISNVIDERDYFYSEEQEYVKGNVSESVPHVTLLYGLLNNPKVIEKHVNTVLGEWDIESLTIDEVSFFYGKDTEYITIIALVDVTDKLLEGHQRLSLLPHINTFGEYNPHITLAYVKLSAPWSEYVTKLNSLYKGTVIKTTDLNLGD